MQLKQWNLALGVLHAAQAVAVFLLAKDFRVPFRTEYLTFNEATQSLESASRLLFELPLAWLIVAFFAMSSIAHFVIAGPWFKKYKADLEKGMNRARWVEYAVSASTMMVAIAALVGVVSLPLAFSMFALTAVMNLLGLVMETHNQGQAKPNWLSYWVGTIAGLVPWLVVASYFVSNWFYGSGNPPTFVYIIFVSIFVAFSSFAVNMWLQYKKKGKWADYLYGEKAYMVLSLVAKSALAWQIFGGTLRP
ncbi:heliorhodopsin HeR [Candidatus Saccharibacteria bacterium]|nr:heliorhodopsin HeR [Candidatus Saccharibacteria bacterium]MCB9821337.1 heliorhodopsin HeR [Candidatus Nomurabacteria bacterium]